MTIEWIDFEKVDIRIGTIISASDLPNARKPAYVLQIDFGDEIGIKKSSSQITFHYQKQQLINRQVMAVMNFSPRQIGSMISEVLTLGFADENGNIILAIPDKSLANGAKLF